MASPAVRLCACGCGKPITSRVGQARYHPFCAARRVVESWRLAARAGRERRDAGRVPDDISPEEIERRFAAAMAQIRHLRNVQPVQQVGRWQLHR